MLNRLPDQIICHISNNICAIALDNKSIETIVSRTVIYGIGIMPIDVISILLLPLYLPYLTKADAGLELSKTDLDMPVLFSGPRVAVDIFKLYSDSPDAC